MFKLEIMDILPKHFFILKYCGFWYESYGRFRIIKQIYTLSIISLILYLTITQVWALVLLNGNFQKFIDCLPLTLTYVGFSCKVANFLCRHKSMNKLLNILRMEVCQPRTLKEKCILSKYQTLNSKILIIYMSLGQVTGLFLLILPFMKSKNEEINLPYETYQPFDLKNPINFFLAYIVQVLSSTISILLNITLDSMIFALIYLICGQFDLYYYRIVSCNKNTPLRFHIVHHNAIQSIFRNTQLFFMIVVLPFFMCSLLSVCVTLFQSLQEGNNSTKFTSAVLYILTVLVEMFMYCWIGNELKLKSTNVTDALYKSNWIQLTPKERKDYLFMMLIGQKDLIMSYHGQCILSLKTYVWIIKTSYAIFNLLQCTSNNNKYE